MALSLAHAPLLRFGPDGVPPVGWTSDGLALRAGPPSIGTEPDPRLVVDASSRAVVLFADEHNELRVVRVRARRPGGSLRRAGRAAATPAPLARRRACWGCS